jgi:DNA-binding NtrC family response regulator
MNAPPSLSQATAALDDTVRQAWVPGLDRHPIPFSPDERAVGAAPERTPRILIVEDEYLVANEVEAALADAGFEIAGIAASAAEALRLARLEKPSLAIVDIRLIGPRDGIEAAIEMAQILGIRSVFTTAHSDPAMRARAAPAAPLGWLPKPYRMEQLIATVRRALKDLEPGSHDDR